MVSIELCSTLVTNELDEYEPARTEQRRWRSRNTTKECGKETDFCYNVTADVASFSTLQKAGCNTLICQYNMNECVEKNITGIPVKFCCCNDADYCNKRVETEELGVIDKGANLLKALNDFLG